MGSPLGFFNIHSVAKLQKNEEGPFGEKVAMPKKNKVGTFWSRPVLYVTRESFLAQFPGPTVTIWRLKILVELFWSLQVYQKKIFDVRCTAS